MSSRNRAPRRGHSPVLMFIGGFACAVLAGACGLIYFLNGTGAAKLRRAKSPAAASLAPLAAATSPAAAAQTSATPDTAATEAAPMPSHAHTETELAAAYHCRIQPQSRPFNAELFVLEDQQPAPFQAQMRRATPLPAGFSEGPLRVQWSATAGQVQAQDGATTPNLALYTPPAASTWVRLRASCELQLNAPGGAAPLIIHKQAELQLLTPIASAGNLVDGLLDGYRIGHYLTPDDPDELARHNIRSDWFQRHPKKYDIPASFYKVETPMKALLISPHVTLGTFTIDFPWKSLGMPQYIALDMNLVQKLEDLRDLMRAGGIMVSSFKPIYGFRPPAFNLGTIADHPNATLKEPLSMHQYGRAIDLIVDEDNDGQLDDLNGDGIFDVYDAGVIMYYVNQLDRRYRAEGRTDMVGGAGIYWDNDFIERNQYYKARHPRRPLSTPYVHVDTRGFMGEGGRLIRWSDKENEAWPDGFTIQWSNPNKVYWGSRTHEGKLPVNAKPSSELGAKRKAKTPAQPAAAHKTKSAGAAPHPAEPKAAHSARLAPGGSALPADPLPLPAENGEAYR